MSYLHCPRCQRAYNLAVQPACPQCGVQPGTPIDPTEDVIVAAEQLARAMARATPDQIAAAEARLDRLALPAGEVRFALSAGDVAVTQNIPSESRAARGASILRAVRSAVMPTPSPQQAILASLVIALLTHIAIPPRKTIAARAATWSSRARALLARF